MPHPERERVMEFVAGLLGDEEATSIYSHLAQCSPCTQRYQALRRIYLDFDGSWNEFLEEFRLRAAAFEAGLVADGALAPVLTIRGLLDGTRRFATAAMDNVARKLTKKLETGLSIEAVFVPAYTGVGDAKTDPGARRLAKEASEKCAAADDNEALKKLAKVSETDPIVSETAKLDLISREKIVGEVIVQSRSRLVSILAYPALLGTTHCTAVLRLLDAEDGAERRARLKSVEGAKYLLAEFENVPDGPFSVGLEIIPPVS